MWVKNQKDKMFIERFPVLNWLYLSLYKYEFYYLVHSLQPSQSEVQTRLFENT